MFPEFALVEAVAFLRAAEQPGARRSGVAAAK